MSTGTSVPKPRVSGMDVSDSALLATLLTEAPVGFAFIGGDLRFRRVNQVLAGLYAVDQGEYAGRLPSQVWPEDLGARAEEAVRRVLEQDEPVIEGDQPITQGEDVGYWSFSWYPSHDPEGEITGVVLIAIDNTERKNSGEALRRSDERYRSLVQAGAQVVWVTTPTGKIAEDSPEWRWITGQSVDEYLGSGWLEAIHPEDRERVEREWLDCVDTGKTFDSRYRVRTKSGSYRHYDVRAVPIERDGKIVEWVGASTDVTGQREAEEMRGRLTEQLSAAALRTVRLQQATSMLAEAITVEQVVEVITEVGRSAIGAERSAVALLDPERLRLRTINPSGLPDIPGGPSGDMALDTPSVMTAAILARRPLLLESPDSMRKHFEDQVNVDTFLAAQRRAGVGGPAAAGLGRAAGCAAVRVHPAAAGDRRGAGVPGGAGGPVRAGPGARGDVRARAHHGRDPAAQPAARPAAHGARDHPGGQLPAGDQEHGDRRGLVRRVPPPGRQAGGGHGRRHGQGADRRGRHGPGPQRAARAGADRPQAGRRAGRPRPAVHRH